MPIKHQHLTVIPDDPNYDVSADEWNAGHIISGGTNGDVLVRNVAAPDGWSQVPSGTGVLSCAGVGQLPTFGGPAAGGIAIPPSQGGTGLSSYQIGDLLVATGTTTLSRLPAAPAGTLFASTGVNGIPVWSTDPTLTGVLSAQGVSAQSLSATTVFTAAIQTGTIPAHTGAIRIGNLATSLFNGIFARNAADTADVQLLALDSTNVGVMNTNVLVNGSLQSTALLANPGGQFIAGVALATMRFGDPALPCEIRGSNIQINTLVTSLTAPIGTATTQLATTAFVIQNMASVGAGNVVGGPPATDSGIVLFNGTTGRIIKDSGVLVTSLAPLASPALTGVPTAPTPPIGTNSTQIATTAFVRTMLAGSQMVTLTGAQNDLSLTASVRLVRCNNATPLTITGMSAGYDGQTVTIISIGTGAVHLAHESTASVAPNRFINTATSTTTPLAPNSGRATYVYDMTSTRWRLTGHDQGAAIPYTPTWTALGGFPSINPTLGNGLFTASYLLWGRVIDVFIQLDIGSTTTFGQGYWVIGTPAVLSGISPVGSGFITTNLVNNHPVIGTIPTDGLVVVLTSSEHNVGGTQVNGADPSSPNGLVAGDVLRIALARYPIA